MWKVMLISDLLDGGGREILHRSGFGKGNLEEGRLDMKASSYASKPTKELRR